MQPRQGQGQISSLTGLVASSIDLQKLISTCNSPSFADSGICSWETWRERAFLRYGVPYEYFDLARSVLSEPNEEVPGDIGVPARNISGSFRYLEIATKFELLPESAASLNKRTATVSGIYESYAGVLEALKRNDPEGIDIFFPRLRESQREQLIQNIREHDEDILPKKFRFAAFGHLIDLLFGTATREVLTEGFTDDEGEIIKPYQPSDWEISVEEAEKNKEDDGSRMIKGVGGESEEEFFEGLMYLISQGCRFALEQALEILVGEDKISILEPIFLSALKSGQVDMVDRVLFLRSLLGLPIDGKTVLDIVSPAPFQISFIDGGRNPPIVQVPNPQQIPDRYFDAACYGGNPLLVDFLLAMNDEPEYLPSTLGIIEGYFTRRDPVGYYQVLQRCGFVFSSENISSLGDIDIDLFLSSFKSNYFTGWRNFDYDVLTESKGNVDILLTYLPRYQQYMEGMDEKAKLRSRGKPSIVHEFKKKLYPLSALLVSGAYTNY
nr:hypothetical protein pmam_319 [Pithovirus mammoth]